MLAEIFEYLEEKQAGEYLSEMDIHKAAELIAELDTDTAVNILAETDKDRRSLILEAVEPAIRTELRLIASFDDDEIGSRMTTNCIIIGEDMSVKQAMTALVSQARKNDNISTLFVVDENKRSALSPRRISSKLRTTRWARITQSWAVFPPRKISTSLCSPA